MENYKLALDKYFETKFILLFPELLREKIINLITGGKRIRPILFLLFADIDSNKPINNYTENEIIILNYACIIELIHNLSLIIDDLPEMDNDITRRDKPTFHIKNGIKYTYFFIYYLLNKCILLMFNKLTENKLEENRVYFNILKSIFIRNLNNLLDGQYIDIELAKSNNDFENEIENDCDYTILLNIINPYLEDKEERKNEHEKEQNKKNKIKTNILLNFKKTGSLFHLPIIAGLIMQFWNKKIPLEHLQFNSTFSFGFNNIIETWANIFGYLFQLSDDIIDYESDLIHRKINICHILNINPQKAKNLLNDITYWLENSISNPISINPSININTMILLQIIQFIKNRLE